MPQSPLDAPAGKEIEGVCARQAMTSRAPGQPGRPRDGGPIGDVQIAVVQKVPVTPIAPRLDRRMRGTERHDVALPTREERIDRFEELRRCYWVDPDAVHERAARAPPTRVIVGGARVDHGVGQADAALTDSGAGSPRPVSM